MPRATAYARLCVVGVSLRPRSGQPDKLEAFVEFYNNRYVPTITELRSLQARCRSSDDELRWLLALISDTGLRLSEALGLSCGDVCLDTPHPYVVIEPKSWRRLKTSDSERLVPLVGEALWAVQRAADASDTRHLFPSYCDGPPYSGLGPACTEVCFMHDDQYEWRLLF